MTAACAAFLLTALEATAEDHDSFKRDHFFDLIETLSPAKGPTDFSLANGLCKNSHFQASPKQDLTKNYPFYAPRSLLSAQPPPENDLCADAISIQVGNFQAVTCNAVRDGANSCSNGASAPDVWYKYTADFQGNLVVDTLGSNYDTELTAYTNCPGNQMNEIACNDDCGNPGSCLTIPVLKDQTYFFRLSGFQNSFGAFNLNVSREGFVSGKIRDQKTGQPLSGISILVYTPNGDFITSVASDRSGKYVVPELASGTYIVRTINSLAYIDELYKDHICEGVTCQPDSATPVFVNGGSVTSHVDFALTPGGAITGTVTDAITGEALDEIEVHIHDANNNHVSIDFTDATGNYSPFDGLPEGDYLVLAFNTKGYVDELYPGIPCVNAFCNPFAGQTIHVVAGSVTSGINLALTPGGDIRGIVSDFSTALPITGIQLNVYDSFGRRITGGSSGPSGDYFLFNRLPTGSYFVRTLNGIGYADELYPDLPCTSDICTVTNGTPIQVTAGQTSHADFSLHTGGLISGKVTDSSGSPLPGISLDLHDAADNHIRFVFTDSGGQYNSFYGLYSGNYFLRTMNFSGFVDELYNNITCVGSLCNITAGTAIPVTLGVMTPTIDFVLQRGGTISGNVTNATSGLPLVNTVVPAYDTNTINLLSFGITDTCGDYTTLSGLLTGNYFERTFNNFGLTDEVFDNKPCLDGICSPNGATSIPVNLGEKTNRIDFALGSILLRDNFENGILTWRVQSPTWEETNGSLTGVNIGSGKASILAPVPWTPSGASECTLCTFQIVFNTTGGQGSKTSVQPWFRDNGNQVELSIDENSDRWKLKQFANGRLVSSARRIKSIQPGVSYQIKLQYSSNRLRLYVDGELLINMPAGATPAGGLRLRVHDTVTSFEDVLIY